jgi:hypothetical protein
MQSLQDAANLAKVSTEHLIEEIQRRLRCANKQEKKTIFIGKYVRSRTIAAGEEVEGT